MDDFGTEQVVPSYSPTNLTAPISYDVQYAMNAVDAIRRLPDNYVERTDVKQVIGQSEEYVLSQKGVDDNYAKKVGVENDLVVGAAKALAGSQRQEKEFSTMVVDGADGIAKINEAMGNSLVWNQQLRHPNFDAVGNDWVSPHGTFSVSGNVGTLTVAENITSSNVGIRQSFPWVSAHKYYVAVSIKTNDNSSGKLFAGLNHSSYGCVQENGVNDSFVRVKGIVSNTDTQVTSGSPLILGQQSARYGVVLQFKDASLFDLTLMFGAGNEPSTVEEFEALFPLPYYEYNAGEIISNKTQSLGITGFNQWDEEWEQGRYDTQTGQKIESSDSLRSKNLIKVIPSTLYYFKSPSNQTNQNIYILEFDANKQFIRYWGYRINNEFTPDANVGYIAFYTIGVISYNHDICINLSDPNRNGTYESYKHADLPLNLSTITGKLNGEGESVVIFPDGMCSAGTAYDSLLVDEDGYARKAVKRMRSVDLGTLNYNSSSYSNSSRQGWECDFDELGIKPSSSNRAPVNAKSAYYIPVSVESTWKPGDVSYTAMVAGTTRLIFLVNPSQYNDANAFKVAMSGVELIYELETPETYDLDEPIPMTFMAYHGGTITQTPQAPDSAPMRMNVTFAIDAVSTINGLPQNYVSKESLQAMLAAMQSAGIFSAYTMTFNASTGKYEFTFTVSNS